MKDVKVEGLFREVKYPIRLFDENNNEIYFKNSVGYSWIKEYDGNEIYFKDSEGYSWVQEFDGNNNEIYYKNSAGYSWVKEYDGNEIYFKDSDGYSWVSEFDENSNLLYSKDSKGIIIDERPKKKYTIKELEELIGVNNIEIIKEKKWKM